MFTNRIRARNISGVLIVCACCLTVGKGWTDAAHSTTEIRSAGLQGTALSAVPPTTHPLSTLPESLTDAEWLDQAIAVTDAVAEKPDIEITGYASSEDRIDLRFHVNRWEAGRNSELALVAPAGDITSCTLQELTTLPPQDPDTVGQAGAYATPQTRRVEAAHAGYVRSHRVIRLSVPTYSAQIPGQRLGDGLLHLEFAARARTTTTSSAWGDAQNTGVLCAALERFVANPQDIRRFAVASPDDIPGDCPVPSWQPGQVDGIRFRIPVSKTGLYRVSGADLQSSGVPISQTRPSHLHLFLNGEEQPMLFLPADADTKADAIAPEDQFVFYAQENPSPYSIINCFWMAMSAASPPLPMPVVPSAGATEQAESAVVFPYRLTIEEDTRVLTQSDQFLSILGYRWVWQALDTSGSATLKFDAPGLANLQMELPARIFFYAHSWAHGHNLVLRVSVNGSPARSFPISSAADDSKSFVIPAGILKATDNMAVVELRDQQSSATASTGKPTDGDIELYLDRLDITYPRYYQASSSGLEFVSPSRELAQETPATTVPRTVDYRIAYPSVSERIVVVDVTDTAPRVILPEIKRGTGTRGMSVAAFRVSEATSRRYLLADVGSMSTTPLQSWTRSESLRDPSLCADYVIVTHRDFRDTMKSFADVKTAAGHAVKTVDVADIYDQFSCGQETPQAIRTFVRYAATHWKATAANPAATFVLLVGDCTSAYRNQFRNSVVNYVPTYTVETDGVSGDRYASDQWFVDVFGDDLLADALVGRFSVKNTGDLQNVLSKNYNYRARPGRGPWRNTLAFVADHSEFAPAVKKVMRESVPRSFFLKHLFVDDVPWEDNFYFPANISEAKRAKVSPTATRTIRDMFNAGTSVMTFFGHGSPNIWSNERIWFGGDSENSDNLLLNNSDRLPLIVNMTCNSGAIDYPMPKWDVCISEDFMRVPNGGAVACYVPSGPGVTAQHERFTMELNRAILRERVTPLAAGLALANWRYLAAQNPQDLVRMFILLGDPALVLQLPDPISHCCPSQPDGEHLAIGIPQPVRGRDGYYQVYDRNSNEELAAITPGRLEDRLRLPLASADLTPDTGIALSAEETSDYPLQSAGGAFALCPSLAVSSARFAGNGVLRENQLTSLTLAVRNRAGLPARNVRISLVGPADQRLGSTGPSHFLPGEEQSFELVFRLPAGIAHYRLEEQLGAGQVCPLAVPSPLVTASIPNRAPAHGAPVEVDTTTLGLQYVREGEAVRPVVRFTLYNISDIGMADLQVGLLDESNHIVPESVIKLPALVGGAGKQVDLRLPPTTSTMARQYRVRFDPYGIVAGSEGWPTVPVEMRPDRAADLAIPEGGIRPSRSDPFDGQTVFFDVTIANHGGIPAEFLRVDAHDGPSTAAPRIESRLPHSQQTRKLDPGETTSVRLRWDPFHNAGEHRLLFEIVTAQTLWETDTANNSRILPLRVRTKYQLRPAGIHMPTPTGSELSAREVRIVARVENTGESPAHGVRVVFYPTRDHSNPKTALGEVMIDEIPAKSVKEAVLRYRIKPGEEKKGFQFSFEASLKGSLQRVSSP